MRRLMRLPEYFANLLKPIDFLGPLALRLYLVPIFWMAGTQKFYNFQDTIAWFGNETWGLGLPYPELMATLATSAELAGTFCLLFGFATRLITIPLMVTMVVAITAVHWHNGWPAIAPESFEGYERLHHFLHWLKGAYPEKHHLITEHGRLVILNNGIEFATTYLIMLVSLLFTGAGRFLSLDYWILAFCKRRTTQEL